MLTVRLWENKETHALSSEVEFVKKNHRYISYIIYSVAAKIHKIESHNLLSPSDTYMCQ